VTVTHCRVPKSDGGDAKVLADLVRTDRHNHRLVAGDSDLAEAVKVTARAHQNLVRTRQRQVNQLRSALREYHPGALEVFGATWRATSTRGPRRSATGYAPRNWPLRRSWPTPTAPARPRCCV